MNEREHEREHEREAASTRTTIVAESPFVVGSPVTLSENETHHLRVLRLGVGERIALRDGQGGIAEGTLVRVNKTQAVVDVEQVSYVDRVPPIHLLVPVADRDRLLWLAEKAAELNVASWRPVLWQRSRSVSPRGEGPTFRAKVQGRMTAAMLQSRSAWTPQLFPESTPESAILAAPAGLRLAFDAAGAPILGAVPADAIVAPVTVAIGPEGGYEAGELAQLREAGFLVCTLGPSVLRFETAAVAAIAVARAILLSRPDGHDLTQTAGVAGAKHE